MILDDTLLEDIRRRELAPGLQLKMIQHGIAHAPRKVMFRCGKEIEICYFVIDITKKCNFDCIYCFRDLHDARTIDMGILKGILEYISAYCHREAIRQIGIQMWGGEPLLAMEQIEYAVNFFRKTDLQVSIDIETNASLVTSEIAERLYNWGVHVGVSLDGFPRLHNQQRKLVGGGSSAESVEEGIHNLQRFYGERVGGITVITKKNYRYIKDILDYFIYHLHLTSMKFNLVRDNKHAEEQELALDEKEIFWFANELLDYLQAFRCLGTNFTEGNIEIRVKNLLQRSNISCCISHGCQGGKRMISFDQEGNIFPCEMVDFPEEKIGSIYDEAELKVQLERAIKKNRFFLPKEDERCHDCPWQCYCGGGCSSRNRYLARDGQIDEAECCLNRAIYPRLIEGILDGYIK